MTKQRVNLFFTTAIVLAVISAVIAFPGPLNKGIDFLNSTIDLGIPHIPEKPYQYGLDLQGGSRLIYEAEMSDIPRGDRGKALGAARGVIERRVNSFGVSGVQVKTNVTGDHYRLIVLLPNVKNLDEAMKVIGETPRLEFKTKNPLPELTEEQRKEMEEYNEKAQERAKEALSKISESDFSTVAKEYSEDKSTKDQGGDIGWVSKGQLPSPIDRTVFNLKKGEVSDKVIEATSSFHIIKRTDSRTVGNVEQARVSRILIKKKTKKDVLDLEDWDPWQYTGLGGKQLEETTVRIDKNTQEPQVILNFNEKGAKKLAEITKNNIGKPLAIFLDGKSIIDTTGDGKITSADIYAPTIQSEITNGKASISGGMDVERARTIVERLREGALPVPINLIYQKTVGSTLGKISLQKSLKAGIIGFLAVIVFMIAFYRLPGFLASLSLGLYGALVLTLFKTIPVTLSMAGIGGVILSVGMAIDANILIFSRFREELEKKSSFKASVVEGFRRAWPSIRDGNFTTLIATVILYGFGTSFVKGFALTLGLGVLVSMFAAMFITRTLLQKFEDTKLEKIDWLWK